MVSDALWLNQTLKHNNVQSEGGAAMIRLFVTNVDVIKLYVRIEYNRKPGFSRAKETVETTAV